MAVIKVKRPKLRWYEHLFLPTLLKGLTITFKHAVSAIRGKAQGSEELASSGLGVTMQYPEQKWALPDAYRGIPVLVKDQDGRTKCVACYLCEFICPPLAIKIEAGELPTDNNVEKYPKKFDINMLRCIMCGLCEEVCPEEAIFMSKHYELAGGSREEMIFDKEKLLALGGMRQDPIKKWAHK